METPGHTKGGVCYIADNAVFTGDTLFFCSCGRTDFPGGSFEEIKIVFIVLPPLIKIIRFIPVTKRFQLLILKTK